jgi:membrane fusion protein (multidrug efflux system)
VARDAKGQATVLVVGDDDQVELRPVDASRAVGDAWLVASGLRASERVVVDGLQRARPGAKVKPVPVAAAQAAAPSGPATAEKAAR